MKSDCWLLGPRGSAFLLQVKARQQEVSVAGILSPLICLSLVCKGSLRALLLQALPHSCTMKRQPRASKSLLGFTCSFGHLFLRQHQKEKELANLPQILGAGFTQSPRIWSEIPLITGSIWALMLRRQPTSEARWADLESFPRLHMLKRSLSWYILWQESSSAAPCSVSTSIQAVTN